MKMEIEKEITTLKEEVNELKEKNRQLEEDIKDVRAIKALLKAYSAQIESWLQ